MQQQSTVRAFGGQQNQYTHASRVLGCDMAFSVFLPPQAESQNVPVMYWLSGLTCTDENFATKSGAQRVASEIGMAIVMPDTSPRGEHVPDDPDGAWDFGKGAGFYVDATQAPWNANYKMESYVTEELRELVEGKLPLDATRRIISGHSMGGHGALTLGLKHPHLYRAISAFAPIVAPSQVPWGKKAFGYLLGDNEKAWQAHDACALIRQAAQTAPILIDQGTTDSFLEEQLQTQRLLVAIGSRELPIQIRMQAGYDHSYYFVASFIADHLRFLRNALD